MTVERHLWLAAALGLGAFVVFVAALAFALLRPARPRRARWPLQAALSLVPAALAFVLFFVGFRGYVDAAVAPGDAIEIVATAAAWRWSFAYPSGTTGDDALRVPAGRAVHVTVRSSDLVHRVDAPAVHASAEARPGADGSVWFVAARPGDSPLWCGDACGGHPEMRSTLKVLDAAAWDDFNDDGSKLPPAEYGARLYKKSLCVTCHSLDGKPGVAPSFKGIFGKHEALADGSTVLVDEAYIKESILTPTAKVVRGFQPVMPPFAGQLSDKQIGALTAFIKGQKP